MLKKKSLWIIKVGSQLTIQDEWVNSWIQQVNTLVRTKKIKIIWVTSGAIVHGLQRIESQMAKKKFYITHLGDTQALSAIGQPLLMQKYLLALKRVKQLGAQILLTVDDLKNPKRKKLLIRTLKTLLDYGVLPILNENDAVSTQEIEFGDNDNLSARLAITLRADKLILLTDVMALKDQNQKPVFKLKKVTSQVLNWVRDEKKQSQTWQGRGGMKSKLLAAKKAQKNGIETWILPGSKKNILISFEENLRQKKINFVGTQVMALK